MLKGATFGALMGVLWAGWVMAAQLTLDHPREIHLDPLGGFAVTLLLTTFLVATFAGPGAFLLALALFNGMREEIRKGTPRRTLILKAMLVGLPMGLLNLVLVFTAISFLDGQPYWGFTLLTTYLPGALAGGAGLGLGVTLGVPADRKIDEVIEWL